MKQLFLFSVFLIAVFLYVIYTNTNMDMFIDSVVEETKPLSDVQWIGNTAVWPGVPYKTRNEIPPNVTFLFIGDSLSRRLAATMNVFLTKDNPTELEIKRDRAVHKTVRHGDRVTSHWVPTMSKYLENEEWKKEHYDYVMVSIGLHDAERGGAHDLIPEFVERIKNDGVYFRTCPYPDIPRSKANITTLDMVNRKIRDAIPHEKLIDGQTLMRGRDVGSTRIKGDTLNHFGPAGRIALLQLTLLRLF